MDVYINFYSLDNDELSIIRTANNVRDDNSSIAIVIGENATLLSMNIIVPQTIIFAGCFDDLSISNINRNRIQNNNITGVYVNLDITKYIKMISDKYVLMNDPDCRFDPRLRNRNFVHSHYFVCSLHRY